MRKLMLIGAIAAAATAAACSKPAAERADGGQAATQAAKPASGGGALTLQPKRKAGLWDISMGGGAGVKIAAQMCVDEATAADFDIKRPEASDAKCSKSKVQRTGGGWTFESTCQVPGGTMTSKGVISGDLNDNYQMDLTSRMDPPPRGMPAETKMSMKARWLGPCPAGMKPGAMKMGSMTFGGG